MRGSIGRLAAGLLAVALLALPGCGRSADRGGNGGNVLRIGNGAEPEGLDPHIVTGVPEDRILTNLFEGLVNMTQEGLKPIPGVAESWTESADGLMFTFHLRNNAKWSNGDPVTAADFLYAWRRMLTPSMAAEYAYMLFVMKNAREYNEGKLTDFGQVGCRAIDDYTLEVTLSNPTPYFLQLHTHYTWYPVHQATIEKFGAMDDRVSKWTRPGNFVGNGAFQLVRWEPNRILTVTKSDTYWNRDSVRLDGIEFHPVVDLQTEERMFRSGALDITYDLGVSKVPGYRKDHPEVLRLDAYLGSYFYRVNTTRKPLDDVRVRRALAMATDRDAIVNNVMRRGERAAGWLTPPDTNGYTSRSSVAYDPEAARRLLAEAGYPGGKGMRSFEILYNTHDNHRLIAEAIQQMWKKNLGVDVTLTNQDWKVYLTNTSNEIMDYDVARAGWIGDYVDAMNFLECFTTDNGNNRTGWSSPAYDNFLKQAAAEAELDKRNEFYQLAEKILVEEMPIIPIYFYTRPFLLSTDVKGLAPNVRGQMYLDQIYLKRNGD